MTTKIPLSGKIKKVGLYALYTGLASSMLATTGPLVANGGGSSKDVMFKRKLGWVSVCNQLKRYLWERVVKFYNYLKRKIARPHSFRASYMQNIK